MHTKKKEQEKIEFNDSLTSDILFKETLGNPKNRRFLEYLLEVTMGYEIGALRNKLAVSYESYLEKTRLNDKDMRSDLIVIIDNLILVNLEMYSVFTKNSLKKSKSYIMRIYSTQLNKGEDYNNIRKVMQINFVDNVKVEIEEKIVSKNYLINEKTSDDFEIDIIRLDLKDKFNYNKNKELQKLLEFIVASGYEEREVAAEGNEILMDTNKFLEEYKNDESLREFFNADAWNKWVSYADGKDDGLEEGKKEGLEQGKLEGKTERNIEIVKNMLKETDNLEFISRVTNLSIEEVKKLKNEK